MIMRNDGYRGGGRGEAVSYYFSLGNVSGFERKLEQAREIWAGSRGDYGRLGEMMGDLGASRGSSSRHGA